MSKRKNIFAVFVLLAFLGSSLAFAQQAQAPPQAQAPRQPMSFFVTSVATGDGGNLGGLAGADMHCQRLAAAVGAGGKTWHAYLSTQASGSQPAVNARDRIGSGPWYNQAGAVVGDSVAQLHGDTVELTWIDRMSKNNIKTEKGETVRPGFGEPGNIHEALTGTAPGGRAYTDGADHTCSNWTSNGAGAGSARVGHIDRDGRNSMSWNSAVSSRGCSQENLAAVGSGRLFYCFAIN